MAIGVLLVDDHPVIRQGVRAVLKSDSEIAVVGEANNGAEALRAVAELRPDVILMDLVMPVLNGTEATRQALQIRSDIRVLALTSYGQESFLREAISAGACGYLLKKTAGEELVQAIKAVFNGQTWYSPRLARFLSQEPKPAAGSPSPGLSLREGQVLQLLSEGYTDGDIARELSLDIEIVRCERHAVMQKLGITGSELKTAGHNLETL